MSLLTDVVQVCPPRWGHRIADLLGLGAAYRMFCTAPCCPEWSVWAEIEETAA